MADRDDLKEMAEYFGRCYMNAAHGQAQLKFEGYMNTLKNAMQLIDGQEPVKPIRLENWWKCPACSGNIVANMQYCPRCGRKVKWDD